MADKIYFLNNGYFDMRAMLTFGVSVKENSKNPIGFFGTGFKYATAIILRLGGKITVRTRTDDGKEETTTFTKHTEIIGKGETFDFVKYNGNDAGFTTRLGLQWQPWMAYRELRCNCTDEGGTIGTEPDETYQTTVEVECPLIAEAHARVDDYFIRGEPLFKNAEVEIYEGHRPYFYYRGVAVMSTPSESCFSFNVLQKIELSEERTARYTYQLEAPIERALQGMQDAKLLRRVLRSELEADKRWDFMASYTTSKEFREEAYQALKTGTLKNESARRVLETQQAEKAEWEPKELSAVEQQQLDRACSFLFGLDINVRDYPICPVVSLGENVLGRALNGKIYISEQAFMQGTKQVASTLLEEWVHNKHNCSDFSRTMQNWLFDKILTLGENFNKVPL